MFVLQRNKYIQYIYFQILAFKRKFYKIHKIALTHLHKKMPKASKCNIMVYPTTKACNSLILRKKNVMYI